MHDFNKALKNEKVKNLTVIKIFGCKFENIHSETILIHAEINNVFCD